MNNWASWGFLTNLHMLSMMAAVWCWTNILFVVKPRVNSGSMMVKVGALMVLAKMVDANLWTHSRN